VKIFVEKFWEDFFCFFGRMKLGLVASDRDSLALCEFLARSGVELEILLDDRGGPWGEKSWDFVAGRVQKSLEFLRGRGVDAVILPPVWELAMAEDEKILPLFQKILGEEVLPWSVAGKIGLLADLVEEKSQENALRLVEEFAKKNFVPTERQQKIGKFGLKFWLKSSPIRKSFRARLGVNHPMAGRVLRMDLRKFRDAGVDSLLPLDRGFWFFAKKIRGRARTKRVKFKDLRVVEEKFREIVAEKFGENREGDFSVRIFFTDSGAKIRGDKLLLWQLGRGEKVEILWEKLEDF